MMASQDRIVAIVIRDKKVRSVTCLANCLQKLSHHAPSSAGSALGRSKTTQQ